MSAHLCGKFLPDFDWPDVTEGVPCCEGSAYNGPRGCVCWEPVYTLDQVDDLQTGASADVMAKMCADCAFRPGSPERANDPTVVADADLLERTVETATPFWCHNGLRRVTHYRHPGAGATYTPEGLLDSAYTPPIVDGRPYKADGTPADYCAGWAARVLKAANVL